MGKGRKWTEVEIDVLKSNYAERGAVWVGKLLGRSAWGVKVMAVRYGLRRGRAYCGEGFAGDGRFDASGLVVVYGLEVRPVRGARVVNLGINMRV